MRYAATSDSRTACYGQSPGRCGCRPAALTVFRDTMRPTLCGLQILVIGTLCRSTDSVYAGVIRHTGQPQIAMNGSFLQPQGMKHRSPWKSVRWTKANRH